MKFRGKTLMLDCGIHPAYTGFSALPYFDELEDPSSIDLLLVSQYVLQNSTADLATASTWITLLLYLTF